MAKIGPEVHKLVRQIYNRDISEQEFILKLESIEEKHPNSENIGLAIQKGLRMVDAKEEEKEWVWSLAGEVNSEFRSEWEEWSDASNWDV